MRLNQILLILLAGGAAGAFSALFSALGNAAPLLVFLPAFPLLLLGLSHGVRPAVYAALAGTLTAACLDPRDAVSFACFIAAPTLLLMGRLLRHRGEPPLTEWYPALRAVTVLVVAIACCFALSTLVTGPEGEGSLRAVITAQLDEAIPTVDPQTAAAMKMLLSGDWLFLIFVFVGWLLALMLYGFAIMSNGFLRAQNLALRPHLGLYPDDLPVWLLPLLATGGLFAFVGHGADAFNGKVVFLLLMLPYFLAGMAWLHLASLRWRARLLFLALIYGVVIMLVWPAFLIACFGVGRQVAVMLDKRRQIG